MADTVKPMNSRSLILRVAGSNITPAGHAHSDPRHRHSLWSLDFCYGGENTVEVEGRHYLFKCGDILLIAPGQEYRFIYSDKPFSCCSFKFRLPHLSGLLKIQTIYAGDPEGFRKRMAVIAAVKSCMEGFCPPELLARPYAFTIMDSYEGIHILEELLYGVTCHYIRGEARRTSEIASDSLLAKMSEFVYLHGGGPVTVEDLAAHLDYSPGYLRTLVRQHTGNSTKKFIDLERIKIMKEMLLYSDIRIKELADIMQFRDVKYFTRFFRKYTGKTPHAWLRQNYGSASLPDD